MVREDGTAPTALSRRWISSAFHAHICLARFTTRMLFLSLLSFLEEYILSPLVPGPDAHKLNWDVLQLDWASDFKANIDTR